MPPWRGTIQNIESCSLQPLAIACMMLLIEQYAGGAEPPTIHRFPQNSKRFPQNSRSGATLDRCLKIERSEKKSEVTESDFYTDFLMNSAIFF
jgi:hypothetical protein